MLSLYSAVSGFATMPPHPPHGSAESCFCAPPTPMPPHMNCALLLPFAACNESSPQWFWPKTAKVQPHFHAPTAGGNYPLAQADGVIAGGSHQMCLGGTMTAYMGNAGTHPVQGNAAMPTAMRFAKRCAATDGSLLRLPAPLSAVG